MQYSGLSANASKGMQRKTSHRTKKDKLTRTHKRCTHTLLCLCENKYTPYGGSRMSLKVARKP